MIVTFRHALTVPYFSKRRGLCRSGMRTWFAAHGLDYADFARNGIAEETLLEIGDAFAIAAVQWAHECAAREVC